jgi:uncharacterized protein (TIGR02611 family)
VGVRNSIQANWQALKASPPGRRFQDRYERHQRNRNRPLGWRRVLKLGTGLMVCAAGVVMMPAPGPGWLVFILGAGLISDEFLWVARVLDWAERTLRMLYRRVRLWWKRRRQRRARRRSPVRQPGPTRCGDSWGGE